MRSRARSVFTTESRLGAGPVVRSGAVAAYRSVAELEGEPHLVRGELVGSSPHDVEVGAAGTIASFVHITDLHVTDAQSPARFEFVNREWQDPRFRELLTMQRPHETLNMLAIDALVRTINDIDAAPLTHSPLQLVAMTGDAIDNTQHNELANFLALMNGGMVRPDSGRPGYEGVQLPGWPADYVWKPDGPEDADQFQRLLGFPRHPGLIERAMTEFQAQGLRLPWLGCYGNHEQVCQGVGVVTPALAEGMRGSRKPIELSAGIDRDRAVEIFVTEPERFMSGPSLDVAGDLDRRPISRHEFAAALGRETHHVHDVGPVRFITLDTVCDAGGADGTIDVPQLRWLEDRLAEAGDRHVVVLSHHGYDTLSNPRGERRADQLLDLLLRSPNVVLWLNGHIHANRVTPRGNPGEGTGFWEVTTASLVDWPCQARIVEIFETGSGQLAIGCTMLDHDEEGLAGLHRELAGNVPFNDFDSWRPGRPQDRNVLLLLPRR
ncbi:MAG TPA: metallophosphoesterase [Candidatus Udaeobacter sp.]|nr:metallophosphoesterase [Candidatus Udaeobacter sp.]